MTFIRLQVADSQFRIQFPLSAAWWICEWWTYTLQTFVLLSPQLWAQIRDLQLIHGFQVILEARIDRGRDWTWSVERICRTAEPRDLRKCTSDVCDQPFHTVNPSKSKDSYGFLFSSKKTEVLLWGLFGFLMCIACLGWSIDRGL